MSARPEAKSIPAVKQRAAVERTVRSSFPLRWEVKVGERQVSELWGISPTGSVAQMYRFRRDKWEGRTGFGEPWKRVARPMPTPGLPDQMLTDFEGMA